MPLVGSIDLTDIIRMVDANLPIIIINGYGTKETLKEAQQKGADDFIINTNLHSNGGTGFQPVQAQAEVCGHQKLPYDCHLI